jgi:hypothetical protein
MPLLCQFGRDIGVERRGGCWWGEWWGGVATAGMESGGEEWQWLEGGAEERRPGRGVREGCGERGCGLWVDG